MIKQSIILCMLTLFFFHVSGQEDEVITDGPVEKKEKSDKPFIQQTLPPGPVKVESAEQFSTDKEKKFIVSNKDLRETHQLKPGDNITVWYKEKEEGESVKMKGEFLDGDGRILVLGNEENREELELKKITALKVPFKYTVGRRLAGLGKVGLGLAVLGAGTAIVYFSSQYVVLNGPQFVFGVFGSVVGVGVGSIGAYLIGDGSGNVFRTRKCKIEKGWKLSIR